MVFVPVTFVLAALLSAQGAVSAPVDPTSSLLAARAPAPSSSSSGVKKPMTLPLPPKALLRTKSAKFKAAMPSKHAATAAKKTDGDAAHVEGKHHRDDRHSSSKKKSHKGKSHRERKSHKRRILDWGSDDEEDAALMNVQIDVDRRDHDHDHDHDRHHDHDHSHSDASGHDHDHDHSKRLITVYSRDHDHSHSHDSERHHDHDRSHRHGSEKDHDHDHSKRSVVDVDLGSSQFGDSSEYYSPDTTYSYDDTASLLDVDLNLKKRDDGTTYYYIDDNDLIDLDVQLKRRGEHIHSHDRNEHSSDRDEDRHGHKHNHRRKLEFAPLFNATGNEPFKYVGAKQNAVPMQKSGKKNTKRDGGDVPASDGCPELSSAVPGYLQLVTPSTESSKPSPLANLVLTAEPAPASPFMMDGSANISHATVQLVRLGPAPADDSTGLMTVKFVVKMFDAQNANMCCLCASYNQHEVSPLMLSPCANDNSTDFSQSFSYDPVTSFVAPMGGGGDSAPDATKRAVPAPGRFFAQDSFAENVALPPPASSAKAASLSRTSTGTSVTMEDEETSSSSESMTSTSSAPDATTTDEPGTAEDEEPPLVSDITTVTFTTSVTSSAPVTETGAADELIEPTKTVEATSASTTAAAPTETAPAMASNGKDIYLSFRPVVDNIKPADASPSESTTATESTATTSVTATTTDSAVPAMATAKHALDESMTATESTTTTSATATATESAVPAAMATGKHEIDGIPAAVTAKPADAEEDDDLPDCDDDDEDDEDDEDAEVESKMNDASIKATKTVSKLMHSATGAATPAAKPSSMGTSSPPAMEDWPAPYRLRFVREEDTLATEDGEPEQWPEFEGDEASIEGI